MIFAIIHWKIRQGDEYRQLFLDHWREKLHIENRSNLVGEYLSEPLTAAQVQFMCKTFNVPSSPEYQSFFNVGIWKDADSFKREVIDRFVKDDAERPRFEFQPPERMILSLISSRRGLHKLPERDHFG